MRFLSRDKLQQLQLHCARERQAVPRKLESTKSGCRGPEYTVNFDMEIYRYVL